MKRADSIQCPLPRVEVSNAKRISRVLWNCRGKDAFIGQLLYRLVGLFSLQRWSSSAIFQSPQMDPARQVGTRIEIISRSKGAAVITTVSYCSG